MSRVSRDAEERKVLADVALGMGRPDLAEAVDPNEFTRLFRALTLVSIVKYWAFIGRADRALSPLAVDGGLTEAQADAFARTVVDPESLQESWEALRRNTWNPLATVVVEPAIVTYVEMREVVDGGPQRFEGRLRWYLLGPNHEAGEANFRLLAEDPVLERLSSVALPPDGRPVRASLTLRRGPRTDRLVDVEALDDA